MQSAKSLLMQRPTQRMLTDIVPSLLLPRRDRQPQLSSNAFERSFEFNASLDMSGIMLADLDDIGEPMLSSIVDHVMDVGDVREQH